MSTRGSIFYKKPIHIYQEYNDGWIYLTLEDNTPELLIPLMPTRVYFKIKKWQNSKIVRRLWEWITQ